MNKKLIPLVFIASSAFAQIPATLAPKTLSQEHPVASPNKIPFSASAVAANIGGVGTGNIGAAVRVVDSNDVTLGRYTGSLLLTYKGELMTAPLYGDNSDDKPSGGFTWPPFFPIFYTLNGCTGSAYGGIQQSGTRYFALPTIENGQTYLNVVDGKLGSLITYNSYFYPIINLCFNSNGPVDGFLAPIVATVAFPAKLPFFLK